MSEAAATTGEVELQSSGSVYRSALVAEKRLGSAGFVIAALLLHAGAVAAGWYLPKLLDHPVSLRKPVIARLVAQGTPRPKGQLPKKERPPPPAAEPAPAPSIASTKPSSLPAPTRSARTSSKSTSHTPSRRELMERALARAGAQSDTSRIRDELPLAEREGLPEGSPQGTAATAEEGDKYFTAVHDAILANYVLPSVISERERLYLKATLVAFIGPDGSLLRHQILKPSGNALFDQALELALQKTKLPAPPAELVRSLRNDGVELNFKP
jgi:colicin import membrane protein/protein TonB